MQWRMNYAVRTDRHEKYLRSNHDSGLGSLDQIADTILYECKKLIETTDDLSLDEMEQVYACGFANYKQMLSGSKLTAEWIEHFTFSLCDCTITVGCLAEGYPALVQAFDDYAADKWPLNEWKLVPDLEESEDNLAQLDEEIRDLCTDSNGEDFSFLIPREENAQEDWDEYNKDDM